MESYCARDQELRVPETKKKKKKKRKFLTKKNKNKNKNKKTKEKMLMSQKEHNTKDGKEARGRKKLRS